MKKAEGIAVKLDEAVKNLPEALYVRRCSDGNMQVWHSAEDFSGDSDESQVAVYRFDYIAALKTEIRITKL